VLVGFFPMVRRLTLSSPINPRVRPEKRPPRRTRPTTMAMYHMNSGDVGSTWTWGSSCTGVLAERRRIEGVRADREREQGEESCHVMVDHNDCE
jgi:hypothetical protein